MSDQPIDLRVYRVPAWCPQCELPMKGGKSTKYYYDFGVCSFCFIYFIEHREQRWRDGWRPSPEQLKSMLDQVG